MVTALERQVGGDHYKGLNPQPLEVSWWWGLQFPEGSVLKYLYRWHVRGHRDDLRKLIHWAELILEHLDAEGEAAVQDMINSETAHSTPSGCASESSSSGG